VITAAEAVAVPATQDACEFGWVLDETVLGGAAARLATMLDPAFLVEAGWDPPVRVLSLPAQHRLLGRQVCRVGGCAATVHSGLPGVCYRCFTRLTRLGLTAAAIAAAAELPALPTPADQCAVSGCRCSPTVRQAVLCEPHVRQLRRRRPPVSGE